MVEARDDAGGRHPIAVAADLRLGRDHDLVARDRLQRLANYSLGAVARRGVDEIDAECDRLMDQPRGLILGQAGLETQPAEAAGAKPRNADLEAGAAEGGVVHWYVRRPTAGRASVPYTRWRIACSELLSCLPAKASF
jgi:hypothetical protein